MSTIQRGRNSIAQTSRSTADRVRGSGSPATNTVQPPVTGGAAQRGVVVDGFDSRSAQTQAVGGVFTAPAGSKDKVFDGKLVGAGGQTFEPNTPLNQVPAFVPANNPNATATVVYVNGISTNKDGQARELQALANSTGMRAIGVHNATSGMIADVIQAAKDKLNKGKNPAVDSLSDIVYSELKAGRDIHLVGYSHGGLITSRALKDVGNRLRIEDGMSKAQVEQLLSRVNVETFGAAATTYPDGPNYVHYVNNKDPVPVIFGQGSKGWTPGDLFRDAGKGAQVHHFSEKGMFSGAHSLTETYLNHRVPFEEGRAGNF
ncbi:MULTISPECIES: hypothetical protein [Myxococcus]|uniref:DUF676 domain-containing protein n=1 Tax=Myxococcus xanthus TaxID=34 RepID=A0AAE6FZZ6_MYXXA|nr:MULTISPECIES: hypothetical protein [Myxococcus]QDE68374.1 hypothetical protein BHS09_16075 [Myxococcus xanthus]QDE75651.1 hypothetical protein BHS08_16090 [Myxococcus xanthus]QDE82978.1 hypothetical protein BHS07_16250 [Myxococcus xanthus]QDE97222.1 hypothetical protein BHS05_15985 [Myxococcus xanthus]QDF04785.1 hypothetical protein BHS04_16480 [Myxococcus xanthus]